MDDHATPHDAGRLPPHDVVERPWRQSHRGGTREDRMMDRVVANVPPRISGLRFAVSSEIAVRSEDAARAIAHADAVAGDGSSALVRLMVRNESIASSRIEHLEANGDDIARALAGSRANSSAVSMVAAARALQDLLFTVGRMRVITVSDLCDAHHALMVEDESLSDRAWAGRVREDQNWIGGSNHSPRDALFVPPPADLVPGLLDDLEEFVNRDDLPLLVQVTVAHAQFESIHPFTDGNGRIGRALMGAILQRRGVTRNAAVPIASGLYAVRDQYFAALGSYRAGNWEPLFDLLCASTTAAADEAVTTFGRLRALPQAWHAEVSDRAGSALRRLLDTIAEHPTVTADHALELSGTSSAATYAALEKLEGVGILREVTGRKRDRVWVVSDVVDELDDLDRRIRKRVG